MPQAHSFRTSCAGFLAACRAHGGCAHGGRDRKPGVGSRACLRDHPAFGSAQAVRHHPQPLARPLRVTAWLCAVCEPAAPAPSCGSPCRASTTATLSQLTNGVCAVRIRVLLQPCKASDRSCRRAASAAADDHSLLQAARRGRARAALAGCRPGRSARRAFRVRRACRACAARGGGMTAPGVRLAYLIWRQMQRSRAWQQGPGELRMEWEPGFAHAGASASATRCCRQ
jgi:hypothetical protein